MGYYILPGGSYYEGFYVAEGSIEVPQRPTPGHEFINGEWILVHPTHAEMVATVLGKTRETRDALYVVANNIQTSFLALGDSVNAAAVETYKEGLRNIVLLDMSAATTEEEMSALISAQYKLLKGAMPSAVKLKFYQTVQ